MGLLTFNSYFHRSPERKPVRLSAINAEKSFFCLENRHLSEEIIPEYFYTFILVPYPRFFEFCHNKMVLSCNMLCWDIFIIKKLLYNVVQISGWDVIIYLRVWVWCRCQNWVEKTFIFRSSPPDVFCKKGVLRNLIGKHLRQSLFFNKAAGFRPEKEALAQVFSCGFCKISKNTFFTEHLWWLLLYI